MEAVRTVLRCGPFRIDLGDERLWQDAEAIALRPKTWAVLRFLVERPGRLVTKAELIDAVWRGTAIEEKVLNASIAEIRRALGDDARAPRYVATVPRRGFRFIAPLDATHDAPAVLDATSARPGARRGGRHAFVGRTSEFARYDELRAGLRDGRGATVLIAGSAGVGKSRLVAELIARTTDAATDVLVGRCLEGGAVPYWPWAEMVRAALRASTSQQVRERCPAAARELRRIVPSLDGDAPPATREARGDGELARLHLFEALATFFERLAPERALVLVLEDLHWADADSLRVLQALSTRLVARPTLLLITLRDDEVEQPSVAAEALGALRRQPTTEQWRLDGLAIAEARRLVDDVGGGAVPAAVVERIVGATHGNPFFIEELLRHLDELDEPGLAGELHGAPLDLPSSVVEVFERRLRRLPSSCRRLLDAAAVAGDEADERLLAHALDATHASVAEHATAAIRAGILEDARRPGSYRFGHALMRATLLHRLPGPLRRALHARVAGALEALRGDEALPGGDDAALPEVAAHLLQAVPTVALAHALDVVRRAADRAHAQLAYESAAELYRRASRLLAADPSASVVLRAEFAVLLAEAVQRTGDAAAAQEHFRAAVTLARAAGAAQLLARAALGRATVWELDDAEVRAALEDALAAIGDADGALRARLLARLAAALHPLPGTRERCERLADDALAVARASGDSALLGQILADWLAGQWYPDNLRVQHALSEELVDAAGRSDDASLQATAHAWRAVIGMCHGELARAASEVTALVAVAGRLRQPLHLWCARYLSATVAFVRGDLAEAERLSGDAFALGQRCSPAAARQVFAAQMLALRREQDRLAEILPLMQRDDYGAADIVPWTLPLALLDADRLDDARRAFARAWDLGLDAMPGENSRNRGLMVLGAMSLTCAGLGDVARAGALYARIAPRAGSWAMTSFGNVCFGLLANGAGALATTLARWDDAGAHFEQALAEHERTGHVVALARTCQLYAVMLDARGRQSDRAQLRALIARGSELAAMHDLVRVGRTLARLQDRARE